MKKNKSTKRRLLSMVFLLAFMTSSYYTLIIFETGVISDDDGSEIDDIPDLIAPLTSAGEGLDDWWNSDFQYRRCINLTNPYDENLTNWRTYIEIDWVSDKMQPDLGDIRIVENGVQREYYCTKDGTTVRIWFKTNISAQTSDFDTYLYYGNQTCDFDATYYKEFDFGMGWYSFDNDLVAGTVEDKMGHQVVNPGAYDHDGILEGLGSTVGYYDDSHYGKSLKFNDSQTTGYIDAPYTLLQGLTTYTITFWAKRISTGTEYFFSGYAGVGTSGGDNYLLYRAPTIQDWRFYVFRRTTTTHETLYSDGTSSFSNAGLIYSTPSTPLNIRPNGLIIGQEQDAVGGGFVASQCTNAYLDEMRIYNYDLSDDEINWMKQDRALIYEFKEERIRAATVTVEVKDVDGRRITDQKATVYLWNYTTGAYIKNITTATDGTALFEDISYGNYTITVNYTKTLPDSKVREIQVYNSSKVGGAIEYSGLIYTTTINVDLWTIDFEVTDFDGDPLTHGYVIVKDSDSTKLANLTLDSSGETSFTWDNRSHYDYEVYYLNPDIHPDSQDPSVGTLLNSTQAERKNNVHKYYVLEENSDVQGAFTYEVNKDTFLEGSSLGNPGETSVIDTTITFSDMDDNMTSVVIWYMDESGYRSKESKSYLPSFVTTQDQFIYYTAEEETFNVYGVRFELTGNNITQCNGTIEVVLTFAHTEKIQTNMSKLNIKIQDHTYWAPQALLSVRISVNGTYNGPDTDTLVMDYGSLKTDLNGNAYGESTGLVFWFLREITYNITIWATPTLRYQFYINSSDQGIGGPTIYTDHYNYTLNSAKTIILDLRIDNNKKLKFVNGSTEDDPVREYIWDQDVMNFWIVLNRTTDDWSSINIYDNGVETSVSILFKDKSTSQIIYTDSMTLGVNGNWSFSINANKFSAGYESKGYEVIIIASKYDHHPPSNDIRSITIKAVTAGITLHDYDSLPTELDRDVSDTTKYEIRPNHGDLVNISIFYYNNDTSASLTSQLPIMTYTAGSLGAGSAYRDPLNPNYYYLSIDTSSAIIPITASEIIFTVTIIATLENHSQEDISCYLRVQEKAAYINGSFKLKMYPEIYIKDAINFVFAYNSSSERLGSLNVYEYLMYRVEGEAYVEGSQIAGSLIPIANDLYVLDVDTEALAVGEYEIEVSLKKNNYQEKEADIVLTVSKRPITSDSTSLLLSGVQGTSIGVTLVLTDPTNDSVPLIGANVTLEIGGVNYTFTEDPENPGTYTYGFGTGSFNTFLMPSTIIGKVYIEKEDYELTIIPITMVIGMTEIFPGMPTFYFLMIIGAIIAVVGSLVTYRTIQLRRIPTFVKKSGAMRKNIKSKSSISDTLIYPPKEEFMIKMYGDRWKVLGLSLEDILGIQSKKEKSAPGSDMKNIDIDGGGT